MCHFLLAINCTRGRIIHTVREILPSTGPKSLYFLLPVLRLTPLIEGLPLDDLRKILHGGQRQTMAKVHSVEEILPKASTP